MIKQDNRPKKNISENRLDALKNLLQEEISEKPQEVVSEEPKDEVTVATEESSPKKSKKKKSN